MKTLQSKITIFGILICIFTGLVFSIYTYKQQKKFIFQKIEKENESNLETISETIHSNIDQLKSDVLFLASTPPIEGIVRSLNADRVDPIDGSSTEVWFERLEIIFKEMLNFKNDYIQIRYIGVADNGRELVRVERNNSKVIVTHRSNLQQKGGKDYFKQAIKTLPHRVFLSNFSLNEDFGKITYPLQMVLRAAVPIYGNGNKIFGFVIVNVDYSSIFKGINFLQKEKIDFYALNESNELLLRYKNGVEYFSQIQNLEFSSEIKNILTSNNKAEYINDKKESFIKIKKVFYNDTNPKQFLNIILSVNKNITLSAIESSLSHDAILLFCLLIISIICSFIFAKKIVQPIDFLISFTQKLQSGKFVDYKSIQYEKSSDEIGMLTNTLVNMNKNIYEVNKEIKNQKMALDSTAIVAETDSKGRITYVNDNFLKISKYSKDELLGQDHRIVNSGFHPKVFFKDLWETINRGELWKGEVKNKCKDGSYYWVDTTIVPILNEEGRVDKYIAIRFEISKRKQIELDLEKALEAKSSFLANMSHEIRTPLNGILGFTELILDKELESEVRSEVEHIKGCSEGLMAIINDILDISKIDAGKFTINKGPVSLKDLMQSSIVVFKARCTQKNLTLSYSIMDDIPDLIYIDDLRLRQVLLNLIGNSVKFTNQNGNIKIIITKILSSDSKLLNLKFEIQDDGIGISEANKENLFNAFEQADSSITRKFGGTGLGLTISSKIIKLLKGKFWVESEEGVKTSFFFTLSTDLIAQQNLEHKKYLISETSEARLTIKRSFSILVVEDIKINQKLIIRFLNKFGQLDIDLAENGSIGVDKSSKKNYDIIFMDVQMPVMDGFEATRIIKSKLKLKCIIVGLSANAFESDIEEGKNAGMDFYLAKPIVSSKLVEVLSIIDSKICKHKEAS